MNARLFALASGLLALSASASAAGGGGKVFLTVEEALKLAFPEEEVETRTAYLTPEQLAAARELAQVEVPSAIVRYRVARRDGRVVGTAYVDTHLVRSMKETILVVVDPDQRIRRIEVLAFGEPLEYLPHASWYGQFTGHALDSELTTKRGIAGVTGATLTVRATTDAARRVLALHRVLHGAPQSRPAGP